MSNYTWTVDSAVWQIQHGGPTHRTQSAIGWLSDHIGESVYTNMGIAIALLNALVEERGLGNLGDVLAPLPDETETVPEDNTV
jgi:hypothetical protein